jgi:hypothetical protein
VVVKVESERQSNIDRRYAIGKYPHTGSMGKQTVAIHFMIEAVSMPTGQQFTQEHGCRKPDFEENIPNDYKGTTHLGEIPDYPNIKNCRNMSIMWGL